MLTSDILFTEHFNTKQDAILLYLRQTETFVTQKLIRISKTYV